MPACTYTPPLMPGRIMLMTDEKFISPENIEKVVSEAFTEHQINVERENYLMKYERGDQPILYREKKIRSDHNAKLLENIASRIVDIHVGYCFSNPITLVQRARIEVGKDEKSGANDDKGIAYFNKMFAEQRKSSKDMKLAWDLFTTGVGYQMIIPNTDPEAESSFELAVPDPRTTFVIYSNDAFRRPMVCCSYNIHRDGTIDLTAFSKNYRYEMTNAVGDFKNVSTSLNVYGFLPIVEFSLKDRMGIFEKVIPIMDCINLLDSDRVNDVTQAVQAFLWLNNCIIDHDEYEKLKEDGIIATKNNGDGKDANIEYISLNLDQAQQQTFIDSLLRQVEEITSTPSWQEASGGSTTGAMQLSNGWQCLEIAAKTIEQLFAESETEILKNALACIKRDNRDSVPAEIKDIQVADIEIRFCRTKTYDLVSKTNSLVSLINCGVDGLTAFNTVGLFTDSQQAYLDSKKIIDGIQEKMISKETESKNVIPNANAAVDENGNGGVNNKPKDKTEESLQPSKVSGVGD